MKRSILHDHFYKINDPELMEAWVEMMDQQENLLKRIRHKDEMLMIAFTVAFLAIILDFQ